MSMGFAAAGLGFWNLGALRVGAWAVNVGVAQ